MPPNPTKLNLCMDYYIQPLVKQIKLYTCDTADFLTKIINIKSIPINPNVKSLYSNIKNEKRILTLTESFDDRTIKNHRQKKYQPYTPTLNNFNYIGKPYQQIKVNAIVAASSYAHMYGEI